MDTVITATDESGAAVEPKAIPIPRWLVRTFWHAHRFFYTVTRGRGLRTPTADKYGMLLLKSTGRRSGRERRAILAYFEDGSDLVLVPMNGWAEPEPAWWLNLQAKPDAVVELPDGRRDVTARLADQVERARLWDIAAAGPWGEDMHAYAAGRGRETQVVILEPRNAAAGAWLEHPQGL
jgi:F420H(2)-dependent quinone reductase